MEEPSEVGYAFCEVCQTMRSGDLHRDLTDKAKGLCYYYICREADKHGVRHTFSVATAKGVEELKAKNTEEARDALNKIKIQNRSNDAMKVLGLGTAVFFIEEGIKVLHHHHPHHSDTSHTDASDHTADGTHHTGSHASGDHSDGHTGGLGDTLGDVIEWVADGLSRFFHR